MIEEPRMDRAPRAVLVASALLLFLSCASSSVDVSSQFQRYSEASAAHDLTTLATLTADSIVWQLGPMTLEGKAQALGPNAYDAGAQTELTYRNIEVDGNVVTFELIETNEIIRAIGMRELRHYPRFEFKAGLVARKGPSGTKPPHEYSLAEHNRRMAPLRGWIRETHPEVLGELRDADCRFLFSEENGARMLALAREWVAAGAPGRLTD